MSQHFLAVGQYPATTILVNVYISQSDCKYSLLGHIKYVNLHSQRSSSSLTNAEPNTSLAMLSTIGVAWKGIQLDGVRSSLYAGRLQNHQVMFRDTSCIYMFSEKVSS